MASKNLQEKMSWHLESYFCASDFLKVKSHLNDTTLFHWADNFRKMLGKRIKMWEVGRKHFFPMKKTRGVIPNLRDLGEACAICRGLFTILLSGRTIFPPEILRARLIPGQATDVWLHLPNYNPPPCLTLTMYFL